MRTITKFITVNDGQENKVYNGNYIFIVTYPRTEAIISGFLSDGWTLNSRTYKTTPSIQEPGRYTFYEGGWDLLFIKEIDDYEDDNGEELLESIIQNLD